MTLEDFYKNRKTALLHNTLTKEYRYLNIIESEEALKKFLTYSFYFKEDMDLVYMLYKDILFQDMNRKNAYKLIKTLLDKDGKKYLNIDYKEV